MGGFELIIQGQRVSILIEEEQDFGYVEFLSDYAPLFLSLFPKTNRNISILSG